MKKLFASLVITGMMASLTACGSVVTVPGAPTETGSGVETEMGADAETGEKPETGNGETGGERDGAEAGGKIGMLAMSFGYDFQVQMSNGIERAAKEHGYEYMTYDYNGDAENMMTGMDVLASSGVKAYYGLYMSPEAATSFMKEHAEIGVLTQGEIVEGAQAQTENDYQMLAAQFVEALDKHVKEHNIEEGEIAALWLDSCENEDSEYFAAKEEMKQVITSWGEENGFALTAEYFPADDETAANYTAQILNGQPNVKFIFAFNNGFAIAAANEISAAKADSSEYFVFSSEGDQETFRLIAGESSPMKACAYMDIEESGYRVGLQLIRWIEQGAMENVVNEKVLVDSENVTEYLE